MRILQHPGFVIAGFILAVGFNLPHMVSVYEEVSSTGLPEWYAWGMMIVIEFGVLVLAVNNRPWAAQGFAWLIFAINLYHYLAGHEFLRWETIAGVLFSSVPAFFIWYFADLFSDMIMERKKKEREAKQAAEQKAVQKSVHKPVKNKQPGKQKPIRKTEKVNQKIERLRVFIEKYRSEHGTEPPSKLLEKKFGAKRTTIYNWKKQINQA